MTHGPFFLASASPRRRALLEQIGQIPEQIIAADIDETERPGELVRDYVVRVASGKAQAVAGAHTDKIILGADTAVSVGRRILPKTETVDQTRECLALMSGRAHRVYSGVAIAFNDQLITRCVETRVKVRRLTKASIDEYIASDEWRGKAGGYAIQGLFSKHIINIVGSYSNVVGLPLYETANLLTGAFANFKQ